MSLSHLFQDHEIIRDGTSEVPALWSHLLRGSRDVALSWISDCMGLNESSRMGKSVRDALDLGIIAPRRRRDKQSVRLWTLAVMYSPTQALLFDCPSQDVIYASITLPGQFVRIAVSLGSLRFDLYSGHVLWPAGVETVASNISQAIGESIPSIRVIPFYDHGTGDFDCWLENDFDSTVTYYHETCTYREYSKLGFVGWMERRFQEQLELKKAYPK